MGKKVKRKTERDKEKPAVYIEPESRGLSLYDVKRKLQTTQRLIQKKDLKKMFSSPITDTAAPGYSQIIAKPMDFYTINKKISTESYAVFRDYMTDVGLVLQNCMTYNMGDTPYYKYAAKLAPVFEKIFEKELGIKFIITLPSPRSEPILLRDIIPGYESSEDDEKVNGEQDSNADEEDVPDEIVSETQSGHVSSEEMPKEEEEILIGEVFDTTITNENDGKLPQDNAEEVKPASVSTTSEVLATELPPHTEKLTLAQSAASNGVEVNKRSFNALPLNQPSPAPRVLDVSLPLEVDTEQNSDRVSVSSDVSKTSGFSLASSNLQTPSTPTKQRKPFKRKKKSDMYEFVDEDIPQKPFNDIPGKSKLSIEDILNMSSETCGDNEDASFNAETSAPVDKPCSPIQFSDGEENAPSQYASCAADDVPSSGGIEPESKTVIKNDVTEVPTNCESEITLAEGCLQETVITSIESTALLSARMDDNFDSNNQLQVISSAAPMPGMPVQQHVLSNTSNIERVAMDTSSNKALDIQISGNQLTPLNTNSMPTPVSLNSDIETECNVASKTQIAVNTVEVNVVTESSTDQPNASQTSPGVVKKKRGRPKLDRSKISAGYSRPQPVTPAVVVKPNVTVEEVAKPASTQSVKTDMKTTQVLALFPETVQTSMSDVETTLKVVSDLEGIHDPVPDSQSSQNIFPNLKTENQVPNLESVNCIPELTAEELQIDESQTMMVAPSVMDMVPSSPQFQFGESLDNHFCDSETPLIIDQSSCDRSVIGSKNPFNDNVLEIPLPQIDSSETLAAVAAISSDETQESTPNLGVNSVDFNMQVESCAKPLEVVTHLMPQIPPSGPTPVNDTCYPMQQGQPNCIDSIDQVQPFTEDLNLSVSGSAIVSSSLSDLAALLVSPQMTNVSSSKNTSLNSLECSFGFGISPSTLSLTPSTNVSLNFETSPTKIFDDLICCIDTPQKSTPPVSSNLAACSALPPVPFIGQHQIIHQEAPDKTSLKRPANPVENEEPASKVAKELHFAPEELLSKQFDIYNNVCTEEVPLYEPEVSLPFDKLMETPLAGSYELPLGYLKNGGIRKEVRFIPTTPCLENDIVLSKDCFITQCDTDEDLCKLKTYSYLSYGSHGHYAPDKELCEETYTLPSEKDILHSVYSGPVGLQFAESLQKFSARMNPYMKRVVDEFLNSLTDQKHSLYQNKQLLSLPMEDSDNLSITQKEIKQLRTLKKMGIDISFLDEAKPETTTQSKRTNGTTESPTQGKQPLPDIKTVFRSHPENSLGPESVQPETLSVNTNTVLSELSNDANSNSLSISIPVASVSCSNVSPQAVSGFTNSTNSQMNTTSVANTPYLDSMSGGENQNNVFVGSGISSGSQYEQHGMTNVPCSAVDLDMGSSMHNPGSNQPIVSTGQSDLSYASSPTLSISRNGPGHTLVQAPKLQQQSQVKPPTTTTLIKLPPISQFNESLSRSKNERNLKLKETLSVVQNFTIDPDKLERPKSATCIAPANDLRINDMYFHNPRSAPNIGDKYSFSTFPGSFQNEPHMDDTNCTTSYVTNVQINASSESMGNNTSPGYVHDVTTSASSFANEAADMENCNISIPVPCTTSPNSSAGFYTKSDLPNLNHVYDNSAPKPLEEQPPPVDRVSINHSNHQSSPSQQQMCNGYGSSQFSPYYYPSQNERVSEVIEGAGHPVVQPINVFFENPKSSIASSIEGSVKTTHDASSNVEQISNDVSASILPPTWDADSQQNELPEPSLGLQPQTSIATSSEKYLPSTNADAVNS